MTAMPALFVSHGAPTLALRNGAARRFLAEYGSSLGRPAAIVVASAHWERPDARITGASRPATLHDFVGFPDELYRLNYPAPGAPALAERLRSQLGEAAIDAELDPDRGLDHGAWIPLMLLFPDADIPVLQVSLSPDRSTDYHFRLGQALAPIRREGVLVMGSGSVTHNLGEFRGRDHDAPPPEWAVEFGEWLAGAVRDGRTDALLDYRRRAPFAARNHPTEEHLMPLFVALGAAGPGVPGTRVHASHTYGVLAMDAFAFR